MRRISIHRSLREYRVCLNGLRHVLGEGQGKQTAICIQQMLAFLLRNAQQKFQARNLRGCDFHKRMPSASAMR